MEMNQYLQKYSELEFERERFDIPFRKEFLKKNLGRGRQVLHVGCGAGEISRYIADQNNQVSGTEINPEAAFLAAKKGISVKICDPEKGLPFENESFDAVFAGEILDHIYDTRFLFDEMARVLRPGGILLVSAPNLNSLANRLKVLNGEFLEMNGAFPEDRFGRSIRVFNYEKLQELCGMSGFELKEIRGVPSLTTHSQVADIPLGLFGRFFPKLSKLILLKAVKRTHS